MKNSGVLGSEVKSSNWCLVHLYFSSNIIKMQARRIRWAGHVAGMRMNRNKYIVLVGKLQGNTPFGRPKRRWKDDIKMDLTEMGVRGSVVG
jgi:hypothetical protein